MTKIIQTEDGSTTLYTEQFNEHYHSIHGAEQESQLIYIDYGLKERIKALQEKSSQPLKILEMGFGTGLNAWLSLEIAEKTTQAIHYTTIEKFPISLEIAEGLSYANSSEAKELFLRLHQAEWNEDAIITPQFTIKKLAMDLLNFKANDEKFDLIYFDAFSPEAQAELWEENVFQHLAKICKKGAILTTYCAKGEVRRRLQRSGFTVERLAGPIGKREVLRGTLL